MRMLNLAVFLLQAVELCFEGLRHFLYLLAQLDDEFGLLLALKGVAGCFFLPGPLQCFPLFHRLLKQLLMTRAKLFMLNQELLVVSKMRGQFGSKNNNNNNKNTAFS